VQIGAKRTHLGVSGLALIAISHLHADHCLGLPGLMMLRAQMPNPAPLTILGPPGISRFVNQNRELLGFHINYPVCIVEWQDGASAEAYQDQKVRIVWRPVEHTRFCLGFRLEEVERPGKFHPERARQLGIPEGPLWGRLQRGETVRLASDQPIRPDQVAGPARRGRHVAYVVDTRPCQALHDLCEAVDIAFIDGMFLPEDSRHAEDKGHLTVVEAAEAAWRAGARRVVLVHLSPRYSEADLPLLEQAAKQQFALTEMGRDFASYSVRFPDDEYNNELSADGLDL
jgi:ribonuclease Z